MKNVRPNGKVSKKIKVSATTQERHKVFTSFELQQGSIPRPVGLSLLLELPRCLNKALEMTNELS
jgi:hypothetical protein